MRQVLVFVLALALLPAFAAGQAHAQYRVHPNQALAQQNAYYQQLLLQQQLAQQRAAYRQQQQWLAQERKAYLQQQRLARQQRLAQQQRALYPRQQAVLQPRTLTPQQALAWQQALAQLGSGPCQSLTRDLLKGTGDLVQAGPLGAVLGSISLVALAPLTMTADILKWFVE